MMATMRNGPSEFKLMRLLGLGFGADRRSIRISWRRQTSTPLSESAMPVTSAQRIDPKWLSPNGCTIYIYIIETHEINPMHSH